MIRKNPEKRANSKELIQLFEINDLIEEDKFDLNFKYWFILNIMNSIVCKIAKKINKGKFRQKLKPQ